jgi:DMSO/TMAO reductase YedYZ heme-binding membrane subunit
MEKRTKQIIVISSVFSLYLAVFLVFILGPKTVVLYDFTRIFALFGLLTLFVSSIMAAFTKEVYQIFGKPYKKIHHIFAITGLALIIMHPVFLAIVAGSADVFVPRFDDWRTFWFLAGRPALYLILVAFIAGILQPVIKKWWRYVHGLNYIALLFGVVHGMLIGTDLAPNLPGTIFLKVLYVTLLAFATASFGLKRYKSFKRKKQRREKQQSVKTAN